MKHKVLALILTILFLFSAFCEGLNFRDMEDSELWLYYKAVTDELTTRGLLGERPFNAGFYYIGEDLQPGEYNLVHTKKGKESQSYTWIGIYESDTAFKDGEDPLYFYFVQDQGGECHITLIENQFLRVLVINGSCTISRTVTF